MKMKDKKAEQMAIRKKQRDKEKARRNKEPLLERAAPKKLERPSILIVCEGQNTEKSYFRQFKLSSATIVPVGTGFNTVSLVKKAIQLAKETKYDQVWCVFDADPKPSNPKQGPNFNEAIHLAESKGFRLAYSNQAFEYWIILHFLDHQGGQMKRTDYNDKINNSLKPFKLEYDGEGSKLITEDIFNLLESIEDKTKKRRIDLAIKRSDRNFKKFDQSNPAKEESCTCVHNLVEELLKYI